MSLLKSMLYGFGILVSVSRQIKHVWEYANCRTLFAYCNFQSLFADEYLSFPVHYNQIISHYDAFEYIGNSFVDSMSILFSHKPHSSITAIYTYA